MLIKSTSCSHFYLFKKVQTMFVVRTFITIRERTICTFVRSCSHFFVRTFANEWKPQQIVSHTTQCRGEQCICCMSKIRVLNSVFFSSCDHRSEARRKIRQKCAQLLHYSAIIVRSRSPSTKCLLNFVLNLTYLLSNRRSKMLRWIQCFLHFQMDQAQCKISKYI